MTTETGTGTRGATRLGATSTRLGETVTRTEQLRRGDATLLALQDAGGRVGRGLRAATGWLGQTVTPLGWVLTILFVVAVVVGARFGLVEGWAVAAVALVLLALSVPFLLGGVSYEVRFDLDRDRVVAGSEVGAALAVRNTSHRVALPGVLDIPVGPGLVESYVPLLRPGAEHRETVRIAAGRRGIIQVGPMTITRGDPIGLLRRDLSWPQVELVHVHPVTTPLPPTSAGLMKDVDGQPTRTIVDSDLAFHAIREYVPGDSRRHVHWKSTAKTGSLMVRQFEESRRARVAVVLDLLATAYQEESEEEFELAVSAAASLALQSIRDGRDVLMVTAGRRARRRGLTAAITTLPTRTPKALLDATCTIETAPEADRLDAVTALTAQTYRELSIAFLVTGSRATAEELRRAAHAFPIDVVTVIVRAEPGAEPTLRTTRDFAVLTVGALGDLKHLIARGALG
ncbi:MAG TPA: DUF58 domain-containing protein [Microbacteriaceae bacterium]|nr:DUF58 domain-containing protein [Microbacteriaceae bacterium]